MGRTRHGWHGECGLFGVRGVMSTSSALRLHLALAVSEWTGEDTGMWSSALSDAVATAATREKLRKTASEYDDDDDDDGMKTRSG